MLTRFVRLRARYRDLGIIDETAVIGPIQDNTTYAIPVAAYIKAYAQYGMAVLSGEVLGDFLDECLDEWLRLLD